ncbi:MAG: polysaccharide deacetylase family protein [Caldilineaceae bacterium]|nr:polysaccharide deacetylase family protein [Caldilineaceae bacterium]MDE0339775.1 polysaccharide deacetylase family protein [Caldilineaceae bacterium]
MTAFSWTIDDAGWGDSVLVESLSKTTDYLRSRGLGSTIFAVPKPWDEPMSAEWKEALIAARRAGHDLQPLGLTHSDCYEFGPPAWPATSLLPTLQPEFDERREKLMQRYTVKKLRARIEEAKEIFLQDYGIDPTVFRAPCGAISKPLFGALREAGIGYHSSVHISGSGYAHVQEDGGDIAQNWVDDIPYRPFRWYEGIVEAPILNEYTWHESGQRSDEFVALARQDLDRISKHSPVAVILMHTHGNADDFEHTFRVIDVVSEHVGRKPGASFATLGELAASGALAEAATVKGPDILEV